MFRALLFLIPGLALLMVGCGPSGTGKEPATPASTTSTNLRTFQVKGIVIEVTPEQKSVKIKHEDVPGYMQAMTMPFDVHDTNELAGLEPGDSVAFRMLVTETDGWIDQIRKTGAKANIL